jgi:AAA+ superfamily predicted ATPase
MADLAAPYFASSLQYILAELERLDLLLRVQVWRVRQARETDENLSPFYIPEQEIDTLLDQAVGAPLWATAPLPSDLRQNLQAQLDQMMAAIGQMKANTIQQGHSLRLDELAHQFQLNQLDQDLLLVGLAPELDLRYGRLYAYLQDNVSRRQPSVDLALNLLCPDFETKLAAHRRLTSGSPLRAYELLHLLPDPANLQPGWLDQTLKLDDRIVRYLLDGDEPDDQLAAYSQLVTPTAEFAGLHLPAAFPPKLQSLAQQHQNLILYFKGGPGLGKQTTAEALCGMLNRPLLVVNGEQLLAGVKMEDFAAFVRRADREARLQGAALYWADFDALLADDKRLQCQVVMEMLVDRPGLTFLSGNLTWEPDSLPSTTPFIRVEFPALDDAERSQLWAVMLADDAAKTPVVDPDTPAIATKFRFSPGQIKAATNTARNLARWRNPETPAVETADLYAASRLHSNRKLAELAQKIEPHYTWDDIVLPDDRLEQLHEMCDQVKQRGRVLNEWGFRQKLAMGKGTNALFAGPPGTGKTMAADIIAHDLGLDLYKIDLSTVVSKYIGETEKNLSRIFAEAETSNAILFFDEADALFGKRTEVHDAHDRYANLEISYLLQKMEEYEGVVILATNLHKNIDDAFRRRMHFIVEFPFPDAPDRRRIWARIWPADTPRAPDLNLDFMAEQIVVAGGNIRNIALAAAFLAAADGQTVTMLHLIKATRREYNKIGKLLTGREFDSILSSE